MVCYNEMDENTKMLSVYEHITRYFNERALYFNYQVFQLPHILMRVWALVWYFTTNSSLYSHHALFIKII